MSSYIAASVSYLVLARKHRPRRFDDLVGQGHIAKTLHNAIELGRVHHAYLFTGARGVGKTSAARILAMALTCEKGPTPDPCGICDICREITAGQSVDVIEIDGASNTGVDDVRVLREGTRYAPARARRKVYIIDEVHMLSTNAFNALLKTLEEPPAHVVFILATTEVHKIPATILSRVQRHDFKLIPSGELTRHLMSVLDSEKLLYDEDALRIVAREAGGSVRDSLSILDQLLSFVGEEKLTVAHVVSVLGIGDRRLLGELMDAVLARAPGAALRVLHAAIDRGVDLAQLSRAFLSYIHDVEIVGLVSDAATVVELTTEELADARARHESAPKGLFLVLFDRWSRAVEEANKSFAARLVFEMALVDLCQAEPLLPLGDLLARLESLEVRLAGGAPPSTPSGNRSGDRGGGATTSTAVRASGESGWPVPRAAPQAVNAALPAPRSRIDLANPTAVWVAIQSALEKDSPLLASALENAAVEAIDADVIRLRMTESFQMGQVESARARLEAMIEKVLGQPMRLQVRLGESQATMAVPARARVEADIAEQHRHKLENEAREHPMVRKAQELFHAGVAGVKILG